MELKKCKCGGEAKLESVNPDDHGARWEYRVICEKCQRHTEYKNGQDFAAKAWNDGDYVGAKDEIIAEKDKEIEFLKVKNDVLAGMARKVLHHEQHHNQSMQMLKRHLEELVEYYDADKFKESLRRVPPVILSEGKIFHHSLEISPETTQLIMAELDKARRKHPDWPTDPVYGAAIIAEESGELVRAALNHDLINAREEAAQTAVTAIRFLEGK